MTITIPVHRALSTKLAPRSFNVVTRWGYNPWLARVNSTSKDDNDAHSSHLLLRAQSRQSIGTRFYATGTAAKPASRPKAHTGRTPAKRTTKASTSSKPGPKTAAGKRAVGRKLKGKTTAKAKKVVKKPAVKRAPSKTALLAQRRAKNKELKEKALLNSPKELPSTPWRVLFAELQQAGRGTAPASSIAKDAGEKHRNLTPEEKEHYNHVANQNKAANEVAHKKWISSFSPQQIREANNARSQLARLHKESHPNLQAVRKYPPLRDDRQVTRRRSSFALFNRDRHASGDFAHMTVAEAAKLIGREWKALGATEKKKYDDEAAADMARYVEEHTSVYGEPPASTVTPTRTRTRAAKT